MRSIHCLDQHRDAVTPECERTIKNSLPYLCHKELADCKGDEFDQSPLECLREQMAKSPEVVGIKACCSETSPAPASYMTVQRKVAVCSSIVPLRP